VVERYKSSEEIDSSNKTLPGASLPEGMYFAATEYPSTASENTSLQEEILAIERSPISPT
jgi:hypothetical protein